jgi:2-polyprenyl-3-methyl-5-hydroxy-6-metoxy-1,4-benzoquinol methylase
MGNSQSQEEPTAPAGSGGGERFDRSYYQQVTQTEEIRRFGAHWWSNRYFARRLLRVLARVGGSRCLELGCAHGHILRFIESRVEAHGVDISAHAIARSRQVAPLATTQVADIRTGLVDLYPPGHFDAILAKSVLEHLEQPLEVLAACHSLLRPQGALLLSVPSTVNILRRLKGKNWIGTRDPTHVSVLSPDEWSALLAEAGFRVQHTYSTGFWDVPYLPVVPAFVQLPLFGCLTVIALLTDGTFIPPRLGENLIIEAERLE